MVRDGVCPYPEGNFRQEWCVVVVTDGVCAYPEGNFVQSRKQRVDTLQSGDTSRLETERVPWSKDRRGVGDRDDGGGSTSLGLVLKDFSGVTRGFVFPRSSCGLHPESCPWLVVLFDRNEGNLDRRYLGGRVTRFHPSVGSNPPKGSPPRSTTTQPPRGPPPTGPPPLTTSPNGLL